MDDGYVHCMRIAVVLYATDWLYRVLSRRYTSLEDIASLKLADMRREAEEKEEKEDEGEPGTVTGEGMCHVRVGGKVDGSECVKVDVDEGGEFYLN